MAMVTRRYFLGTAARGALSLAAGATLVRQSVSPAGAAPRRTPNIVIIFADDLGYGDLGCYGHPTIRTPHLDRMAAGGMRFTQFYAAESVCTPSRAALLTGRLPIRSGMCSDTRRVLFPDSAGGLPAGEITIAEALKGRGYSTACVGKWHLGHLPQFLPTRNGFDEYFGIPYSNDMKPCPLMDGDKVVEEPADQASLTQRYTERAVQFIRRHRRRPFFLYFPHTFPHVPLYASEGFRGTSLRGLYGDVVEELDWSVGRVLDTLREEGIERDTLVLFTSDNGPWETQKLNGGSAGLLRGGKGSTWPGTVAAGQTVTGLAATLDFLPTCLSLAGAPVPTDRVLDGYDLTPLLRGSGPSPRNSMFYYRGMRLYAARKGPWKAHLATQPGYGGSAEEHDPPLLFHLEHDPSERYDVAEANPEVVADLLRTIEAHRATVEAAPLQLDQRL